MTEHVLEGLQRPGGAQQRVGAHGARVGVSGEVQDGLAGSALSASCRAVCTRLEPQRSSALTFVALVCSAGEAAEALHVALGQALGDDSDS